MVVYVDIVFLTNFVLDFAMLLAAAKVRSVTPSYWRVGVASAIGASYVLLMFVPALAVFYTFVVKCLFSAVMIMTAFGYKSFSRFAGLLAAFYAVNAAAAGTIVGFHYMLQSSNDVWSGILFSQTGGYQYALGVSLWLVALGGAVGAALFRKVNGGAKRKEKKAEFLAEVEIRIDGAAYRCTGLIDTGNHLYDPLTRTPVMVLEAAVWKDAIPKAWLQAIRADEADRIVQFLSEADEAVTEAAAAGSEAPPGVPFPWRERIRLVPYRGINGSARFMLAVKPDAVTIRQGERESTAEKVFVGIEGGTLSADGTYQAIIHPAMVP
ncbi:sigma-E processing peptidase SpoIIGA [Paenibacillus sp.]|uniref:sigma-E processing peptidase SpoIIGA n=1 Tax=Paenibacillus sp. TaxID=58172 RepID=UPI00281275D6|nr:sigma-E processing peptidase SpoIIGA [Paenibacillus sp.]